MPVVVSAIHAPGGPVLQKTGDSTAFDLAALKHRCLDDEPLAAMLVERFVSRLAQKVAQIERLLTENDWPAAASRAHVVKGEAGSLAALDLFGAAADLEQCLTSGHGAQSGPAFSRLGAEAQRCLDAAPAVLAQLAGSSTSESERC
jgi:HPt (histidine-containing phosphotransfer) domain-containing protein